MDRTAREPLEEYVARQERPVDPTAGPVQALAYELRKLRAEAGNPTYRTLARTAGYSATTLSEAAGGTRLPTLEVLLAYVGACGGNPDEWRRRWHEVADEQRPTDTGNVNPADGPPDEDGPLPRRWRRPALLAAVAATATAITVATAVGVARRGSPPATAPSSAPPACPRLPADATFTGTTYGAGAHVRRGASRDQPVQTTIPAGCTVGFTGFCVGEKVYDNTGGTPDVRWFTVAGGGVVSSAVVHGNPPRGLRASECPQGRPLPSTLDFSVTADRSGPLTLRATGPGLDVVGFATSPDGGSGWRQIGLVDVRDPAVGASARTDPPAGGAAVLVAAACLGGDSPTGLIRAVRSTGPGRAVPMPIDPGQQAAAAASACRYPSAG
ncbi:Helix-turn-helix domain-containing protein [Micromonospora pallida]|uniref:Helix-turn-helix domain-containing protein n=1 Tax=Micromonospora pallida TaxID=145854 RepID=A0A1C6TCZ2_9ACTN|nr:helix-turn-helix transcriptional regulator [Micromonospora pallida]SCL39517.1 Helix-turn-helix domain-containing protein [Micromonospora pallida]